MESMRKLRDFLDGRFYAIGAALVLIFTLALGGYALTHRSPLQTVTEAFSTEEKGKLTDLLKQYYQDYADGNVDGVRAIARPLSDREASYLSFMAERIDRYENLKIYTKPGLKSGSYLVSAYINVLFAGQKTKAPGLDFFYVQTDGNGQLYIDNVYSTFNQETMENAMDKEVTKLISAFEKQQDIADLQKQVQDELEKAYAEDPELATYVNTTLQQDLAKWASSLYR